MTVRAVASLIACSSLLAPATGTQQPIRSGTDEVRIDVLVTDRGRPVTGLTADHFEVLDNGVPQTVRLVDARQSIAAILLLDRSHSVVAAGDLPRLVDAAHAFLDALRPGDQVALMTFARGAHLVVPPTGDTSRVKGALSDVLQTTPRRRTEATAMWDALVAAGSIVEDLGARPLVVLLSDGGENASWLARNLPEEAPAVQRARARTVNALQSAGIVVDAMEVPYRPLSSEIQADDVAGPIPAGEVAGAVGGVHYRLPDRRLPEKLAARLTALRAGYVLAFTPDRAQQDGAWHTLRVRLRNARGRVDARAGYMARRPPAER